ncbi:hypothetical protein AB0F13_17170 [Streptomyces sp. NPDC026206]|uniref:hypothetical protein n=1 Tax=Streptomyces sp. NPDC026206 TaxID=3157089 RepID=UPI0033D4A6AB
MERRQGNARRRHPLADQLHDALTIVIVVIVVAVCSPGLSPEALGLIGVVTTVLGSRARARAGQ